MGEHDAMASDGFAAFLHSLPREDCGGNPRVGSNATRQTAVKMVKRSAQLVGGYCPKRQLKQVIQEFFGDPKSLEQHGLICHYHLLRDAVEKRWLIGLILFGADPNNLDARDQVVGTYTTQNRDQIELTLTGICEFLLRDHLEDDQIDQMCEQIPGFEHHYLPG